MPHVDWENALLSSIAASKTSLPHQQEILLKLVTVRFLHPCGQTLQGGQYPLEPTYQLRHTYYESPTSDRNLRGLCDGSHAS